MLPNQTEFAASLREVLARPLDDRAFIFAVIRLFDEAVQGTELDSPEYQALARAVVAAGRILAAEHANDEVRARLSTTIAAAEAYLAAPSDDTYCAYGNAATNSYPFGPGDGCLSVPETGVEGCEVGSGCRSGSGTLASLAIEVGFDRVAASIRAALRDLQGGGGGG